MLCYYFYFPAFWPVPQQNLVNWFSERRERGFPVSSDDLRRQARREFQMWWDGLAVELS